MAVVSEGLADEEPSRHGSAAVVVQVHLQSLVAELHAREPRVRRDESDSVHKMRVTTRRLRSALRTFRPLLDREPAGQLHAELTWLAAVLGEARDAEVMRDRLAALAADEPKELGGPRVATELETTLTRRYLEGHAHVLQVLGSARYARLLGALDSLAEEPPWTPRAADPADDVLPKRLRGEWKRLMKRAKHAKHAPTQDERDAGLHDVRKAAKRLRYAAEALSPVFGKDAAQLASAAENLQEVLGDLQDSVVSQHLLRELAAHTASAGDDALIYGRLHLLEQSHAERARGQYKAALREVRHRRPGDGAGVEGPVLDQSSGSVS